MSAGDRLGGGHCAFRACRTAWNWWQRSSGVRWYDDSKGTNVGSVVKSLAGLEPPVTLIAGGKDKHGDLAPLQAPVAAKVRDLILIGEAAPRMAASIRAADRGTSRRQHG